MKALKKAILKTLVYADIFDYPLTAFEAWQFLITSQKKSLRLIRKFLVLLVKEKKLAKKGRFYFLPNRQQIVAKRLEKEELSRPKLKIAFKVASWLKLIPFLKMVAVTGALAMSNATDNDDIDLLLVTASCRLWLTRLLSVLMVELVAKRRRPEDKKVKDKICLNMFLDEAHLKLPLKERNLFTAHEVCQLKPLWDRQNIYQKFIGLNQWHQKYLANWKS